MNMNISNDTSLPVDSKLDERERSNTKGQRQKNEPSTFSRVLAKKPTSNQDGADIDGNRRSESETNPLAMVTPSQPSPFDGWMEPGKIEPKHVVELPQDLQNLVREIAVVNGGREVHIEINSNVLKGLHIRIEKQDGAVAIQFQSSSEDTARILSRNLDGLSQTLADRGVNVSDIRVTTVQETAKTWSQKQGSKSGQDSGARSQSGRQGKR